MGLNGLKDMGRIIGKTLFHKLTMIEAVDKKLNSPLQGFDTAGKATRPACQTGQVVTQFRVVSFYGIGVGLSVRNLITTVVVPQVIISLKSITVILFGFDGFVYHVLYHRLGTFPDHFIAQKTTGCSIYDGDDVDLLFFSPMKVKSSSISASLTSFGTGALAKLAAFAFTHSETVRW